MNNEWLNRIYGQEKAAADSLSQITPEMIDQMSDEEVDELYNAIVGQVEEEKTAYDSLVELFDHLGRVAAHSFHEEQELLKVADDVGVDPVTLDDAVTEGALELLSELGFQIAE